MKLRAMLLTVLLLALAFPLPAAAAQGPRPARPQAIPLPATPKPLSDPGLYIVKLKEQPLSTYRGDIPGLPATSPEVTGSRKLNLKSTASQRYLDYLAQRRAEFLQAVEAAIGRRPTVRYAYDVVYNGLALELTAEEAAAIANLPMVARVRPDEKRELLTDRGPGWIGAPSLWGAANACAPGGKCGEGVIIGVIDTGINTDHPSFADIGGDGYNHTNPFGPGVYKGWCNSGYPKLVTCNDKLIGAWSYANSGNDPEDDNGHGSHTASTAGGNRLYGITIAAPTISLNFDISGVAPHANIISYDACTNDGCSLTDLLAAINQAVTDGVDVINYSIGSAATTSPWDDDDALAFLDARAAGVFVAASAGNRGPGPGTTGSPANAPWLTSVAAGTHDRALVNALVNLSGGSYPLADIKGRSVTAGYGPAPIVYAGNYGNALCKAGIWAPGTFSGQIVVCDRGEIARVEKAENVQAAGGGGMVLANAASNGDELIADSYAIPGVHITYTDGVALKNWLASGSGHTGTIAGTTKDIKASNGDVMAAFSSRGPNKAINGNVIKPDIMGPGVDILAAVNSATGVTPPEFDFLSGTSMSSPHLAGVGALMVQSRPTWTPAEIQSALMTTAWLQDVREEDGITPVDPFDVGSGRVNVAAAVNAGLVLNVTTTEYQNADPALGGDPTTLNIASMANGACYKTCSWTRTVRNPTATAMSWTGTFTGFNGLTGNLSPSSFSLAGGASQSFTLTIPDVTGLTPGQWYFGRVVFKEANGLAPDAHFPVAVRVSNTTNSLIVTKTATPTGVAPGGTVKFDVTVKNKATTARTFNVTDPVPANATYISGSATGGWTYNSGTNTLSGSVNLPAATFTWVEKTLSGYQSLADMGIPPWDLTGLNLDTGCFLIGGMDFYYLGDYYTDAVISVNGVIRAGQPSVPLCPNNTNLNIPVNDPSDFNDNVIAPFWADLDLSTGNLYGAIVLWNGAAHTVIEWENAKFKQTNQLISFQLWIEDGTDNIWFSYPPGFNTSLGTSTPSATVGAENLAGTQAAKYYYRGSSGSPTGTVPTGAVDVWVGLNPSTATLSYQATASGSAGSNMLNEATVTVSSTTNKAWANAHICGAASTTPTGIGIVSWDYANLDWSAGGSPFNTYQLWRSTSPYFTPGGGGTTKVYDGKAFSFLDKDSGPAIGDPSTNYFYVLRTVNCTGASTADSTPVGEFDFALVPGTP